MPHYYDNYSHSYLEEYPVDHYSPRPPNRQQPLPPPAGHGQYPFRPRRYSQSQLYDSTPDTNYPIHIPHQQRQGLRRQSTWDAVRGTSRHPMRRHPSYLSAHSSLLQTQPQQRQDPRMFQDPHQYEIRQRRSSTGNYPSRMDHGYYDDDYDYDYDHADNDHGADANANAGADSDDDSLNTLEMLALENAKRNENPLATTPSPFDPDNLTIPLSAQVADITVGQQQQQQQRPHYTTHGFGLDDSTNVTNDPPPMVSSGALSESPTDSTAVSSSQQKQQQKQKQQQQQHHHHHHHQSQSQNQQQQQQGQNETSKDPSKKRRWPLSYLFRKSSTGSNFSKTSYNFLKTPSPSNSLSLSSNSSDFSHHSNDLSNNSHHRSISNNNSQTIPPSMLSKQKQKQPQPSIVTFRNPLAPSPTDPNKQQQQRVLSDAEKTALLDYIWAFKAPQVAAQLVSPDNNANVWTGFDYKNQELITNHAMSLLKSGGDQTTNTAAASVHDPGLELFDSHIRKGALPFLVVVSQQMAYYPTSNNTIDKIEIKCLPNTKDTVLLRKKKNGMS